MKRVALVAFALLHVACGVVLLDSGEPESRVDPSVGPRLGSRASRKNSVALLDSMEMGRLLRAAMRTESTYEVVRNFKVLIEHDIYIRLLGADFETWRKHLANASDSVQAALDVVVQNRQSHEAIRSNIRDYFQAMTDADQEIQDSENAMMRSMMDNLPQGQENFQPVISALHFGVGQPILEKRQPFGNILTATAEQEFCTEATNVLLDHECLARQGGFTKQAAELERTIPALPMILTGIVAPEKLDKTLEVITLACHTWLDAYRKLDQRGVSMLRDIGKIVEEELGCEWRRDPLRVDVDC